MSKQRITRPVKRRCRSSKTGHVKTQYVDAQAFRQARRLTGLSISDLARQVHTRQGVGKSWSTVRTALNTTEKEPARLNTLIFDAALDEIASELPDFPEWSRLGILLIDLIRAEAALDNAQYRNQELELRAPRAQQLLTDAIRFTNELRERGDVLFERAEHHEAGAKEMYDEALRLDGEAASTALDQVNDARTNVDVIRRHVADARRAWKADNDVTKRMLEAGELEP